MPHTRVSFEMRQKARSLRNHSTRDAYLKSLGYLVLRVDEPDVTNNAWHVAQLVKDKAVHFIGDPTRPLRGHPPLKGEGEIAP